MRKFSSYGPIDKDSNYHAPREELIDKGYSQLVGENPDKGGHYITVWAPRQTGKSWIMQQILWKLRKDERFSVVKVNLEHLKSQKEVNRIIKGIVHEIASELNIGTPDISKADDLYLMFTKDILKKPLILIMDEFDALEEDAISAVVGVFRNIHNQRSDDPNPSSEKKYLLHGVALIGVRSVLGIENVKGSPFNVQRSLHIPNLTYHETKSMFEWYEQESGQKIEPEVIERLFYETQGQPGLTCWFGELLTEGYDNYQPDKTKPVSMKNFEKVYSAATYVLPNNNILNIISKAKQQPYRETVMELYRTDEKTLFRYDDPGMNFLYMNGVIEQKEDEEDGNAYVKFSCPFVQKRLFNYFSNELFGYVGKVREPFEDLSDTITSQGLNIGNLIRRFERHLKKNREWLLKDAPRRKDLRVCEAVFHFNLFRFICDFLGTRRANVLPEFPTGNGKIDIIIRYMGEMYGVEVKSYTDEFEYHQALKQAARYGKQLGLSEISLVFFVEYADERNREKYERDYEDKDSGVQVRVIIAETGA